ILQSMEAESRIRSLESSILYLQEQHAETLRGLHQEMSRLQTKCSELNFRLSMSSSASAVDDPATTAATAGVARPAKLALLDRERGNRVDELRRALASREKEVADLRAKVDALTAKYDASERRNVAYEAELDQLRAFHAAATAAAAAAVSASSLSSPSPPPPPSTADAGGSSSLNSSAGPVFIRRLPLPAKTGGSQQPPQQQQQHQQPANLILQASAMIPTAAPPHLRALSGGASTGFKGSGV
uniref:CCDC92 domain-containing protein n=1 Tax=Macrostomum lignano TaxID=282301 RepID=A0A1I8GTC0_9PLAT